MLLQQLIMLTIAIFWVQADHSRCAEHSGRTVSGHALPRHHQLSVCAKSHLLRAHGALQYPRMHVTYCRGRMSNKSGDLLDKLRRVVQSANLEPRFRLLDALLMTVDDYQSQCWCLCEMPLAHWNLSTFSVWPYGHFRRISQHHTTWNSCMHLCLK